MKCPGCGGEFAALDGPTHRYMESSPGCWAAYGEVLAREYANPALLEVHRLSVDAYAAQHPGRPSPQTVQSVAMHLVRLILQIERGVRGERANDVMAKLREHRREFTWLEPPPSRGKLTVAHVVPCVELDRHAAAVEAWARATLEAWAPHRAMLERWVMLVAR